MLGSRGVLSEKMSILLGKQSKLSELFFVSLMICTKMRRYFDPTSP
jgi:hypothetical protein